MLLLYKVAILVWLGSFAIASDIYAPMKRACAVTRRMTDEMERMAHKFKPDFRARVHVDQNFDKIINDVSLSFSMLHIDVTSPSAWEALEGFTGLVKRNEVLIANSLLAVSAVYMIDEFCLKSEIEESVRKYEELDERFVKLERKWLLENRLLEDFSGRVKRDPLQNEMEDTTRLQKIKQFVYEVKGLLSEIHYEILTVREQHEKSKSHTVISMGISAIGAALTYLTNDDDYLHQVGKVTMYGGGAGTLYSLDNVAESGKLLEDLENLRDRAEKLYGNIDRVHKKLTKAFA
ncbi:uncharacterized protein [Ptychodera flava]|uniref:uncharacterized protein n=1 Tax=Ptychodera flava TaxID=63121 RepID=UPI003969BB9A